MNKLNVLVSGYPGWLGNRLVTRICKERPEWNLRCLVMRQYKPGNAPFQIVKGDVREYYSLVEATKDIDTVIHCAGIIHAKPKILMDINAQGTLNMLNAADHNNVRNFVYISSNSAVGYTKDKILMTESTARRPYMAYGISKFLAEEYVNGFSLDEKLMTVILRPMWFYGIGQPERQTRLFKMIQKGRPLIVGDGLNLRSMTYTDNLIDGIFCAVDHRELTGKTYWIADKKPYTMNEIYETIANLLDVKDYKPRRLPKFLSGVGRNLDKLLQSLGMYLQIAHVTGESTQNIACDISRAEREIGYSPTIGLEEGMRLSVEWCRRHKLL